LRTAPLWISNETSSLRGPFSMVVPPFSNEYSLIAGPA
jgi:hypothetical protein